RRHGDDPAAALRDARGRRPGARRGARRAGDEGHLGADRDPRPEGQADRRLGRPRRRRERAPALRRGLRAVPRDPGERRPTRDIGDDRWPFPVPIGKDASGWRFDTDAGDDEILARRIGRNERAAMQACLAYVDAQREYYTMDPDKDKLLHYASKFGSTPGKR